MEVIMLNLVGLTQLVSFCVGADDSLPENILGVKTALAGGLAAAPTSNCVTPIKEKASG